MPSIFVATSSFSRDYEQLRTLESLGFEIRFNPYGRRLTVDEVGKFLQEGVVGIVAGVEPLTRAVLSGAKSLKVISRCGIGLDSVDLGAASEFGIRVYNTPDAPTGAVAELALGLILGLMRQISRVDRDLRDGKWSGYMGNLLSAQTVGIVGFGRVGRRVAQLVHAFGSRLVAYDMQTVSMPDYVECSDLDSLLRKSDVITLHVALKAGQEYVIGQPQLAMMKSSAILVNTARGGLVDETALLEALQSGRLAGAACDVFEQEPYRGPLAQLPQVLLTAHMGSYARESRALMEQEAAENLVRGLVECGILDCKAAQR